jgi:hypothetical protein
MGNTDLIVATSIIIFLFLVFIAATLMEFKKMDETGYNPEKKV